MASSLADSPVQFQRDLRSANKEWKRTKDSSAKWAHGTRASAGVQVSIWSGEMLTGSPSQQAKVRPIKEVPNYHKKVHNIVKTRGNYEMPHGRVRAKVHAFQELADSSNRSLHLDLPSPTINYTATQTTTRKNSRSADSIPSTPSAESSSTAGVLYSFDKQDTPGFRKPMTLESFVKAPTGRETEKLVEKEYEIVDGNGEAVKGRKARKCLRQQMPQHAHSADDAADPLRAASGGGGRTVAFEDDDGFELL